MVKTNIKNKKQKVTAIITDRGELVTQEILNKYEVSPGILSKQQVSEIAWGNDIIQPPKDLERLLFWMDIDTTHASCINTKKVDVVGQGYKIIQDPDFFEVRMSSKEIESNKDYIFLKKFLKKVNSDENIISLLKKVYVDYDGCGNGYIEVSEDIKGDVNGLFHSTAYNIRCHKDKTKFVQIVRGTNTWFKKFGYTHPEKKLLNKKTGKWENDVSLNEMASSMIHIKPHCWRSTYYGLPEWLPAIYPIFANLKEREYNLDFFINFGIPAYAVIISGTSVSKDVKEEISKFFSTEIKGSNHKTLTLNTPQGATVKFEKLNVETKESSFRLYRKDNRDEILAAHRVPPYRVGISEEGSLGGNVSNKTDEIYLNSVVDTRQGDFDWVVNELIIKEGFGIIGWLFTLLDINVNDEEKEASIYEKYFKIGVYSSNDIRKLKGDDPYVGGDIYYIPANMIPSGVIEEISDEERKLLEEERKLLEEEENEENARKPKVQSKDDED